MGYVESYKKAEQEFSSICNAAEKMEKDAFDKFAEKVEDLVKDMTRSQMLELYSGKELEGKDKSFLIAAWNKVHKDERCETDAILSLVAIFG